MGAIVVPPYLISTANHQPLSARISQSIFSYYFFTNTLLAYHSSSKLQNFHCHFHIGKSLALHTTSNMIDITTLAPLSPSPTLDRLPHRISWDAEDG